MASAGSIRIYFELLILSYRYDQFLVKKLRTTFQLLMFRFYFNTMHDFLARYHGPRLLLNINFDINVFNLVDFSTAVVCNSNLNVAVLTRGNENEENAPEKKDIFEINKGNLMLYGLR